MERLMFDGTAARQLVLVDDAASPFVVRRERKPAPRLRPVARDVYRELDLRRRRAQIAARKYAE